MGKDGNVIYSHETFNIEYSEVSGYLGSYYIFEEVNITSPIIVKSMSNNEKIIFNIDNEYINVNPSGGKATLSYVCFRSECENRVSVLYNNEPLNLNDIYTKFDVKPDTSYITFNDVDTIKTLSSDIQLGIIRTSHNMTPPRVFAKIKINGAEYINISIDDGIILFNTTQLKEDNYTIEVITMYEDGLNATSASRNITILNRNPTIEINTNTPKINGSLSISTRVLDEDGENMNSGIIIFTFNGEEIDVRNVKNGWVNITYKLPNNMVEGEYSLDAFYSSSGEYYNDIDTLCSVNVSRYYFKELFIPPRIIHYSSRLNLPVQFFNEFGNKPMGEFDVEVLIDDVSLQQFKILNGEFNSLLPTQKLKEGKHNVTLIVKENDMYHSTNATGNLTVIDDRLIHDISINASTFGDNITICAEIKKMNVSHPLIRYTLDNGEFLGLSSVDDGWTNFTCELPVSCKSGEHNLTIEYIDEYGYPSESKTVSFNLMKRPISEKCKNFTTKAGINTTINIQLLDNRNMPVLGNGSCEIFINNKTSVGVAIIEDGRINTTIKTDTLDVGIYNLTIRYTDISGNYYNANITTKLTVQKGVANLNLTQISHIL